MNLNQYFKDPDAKLPIKVIATGSPYTNIPLGSTGTVLRRNKTTYTIRWDRNNQEEDLFIAGSSVAVLEVVET